MNTIWQGMYAPLTVVDSPVDTIVVLLFAADLKVQITVTPALRSAVSLTATITSVRLHAGVKHVCAEGAAGEDMHAQECAVNRTATSISSSVEV